MMRRRRRIQSFNDDDGDEPEGLLQLVIGEVGEKLLVGQ